MRRKNGNRRQAGWVWLVLSVLLAAGCSARYHSMATEGKGMEKFAEERYAHALRFMEEGRFELAREQFAIVERTAITPELKGMAQAGQDKAAAIIEAKR